MCLAQRPIIYEINTWVWLNELSRKYGSIVTRDIGGVCLTPSYRADFASQGIKRNQVSNLDY
jgi:hypothetical protein